MFDITEPLQKIRMDFYGPVNVMSTSSINSLKRWIDDYSWNTKLLLMHKRQDLTNGDWSHLVDQVGSKTGKTL